MLPPPFFSPFPPSGSPSISIWVLANSPSIASSNSSPSWILSSLSTNLRQFRQSLTNRSTTSGSPSRSSRFPKDIVRIDPFYMKFLMNSIFYYCWLLVILNIYREVRNKRLLFSLFGKMGKIDPFKSILPFLPSTNLYLGYSFCRICFFRIVLRTFLLLSLTSFIYYYPLNILLNDIWFPCSISSECP